MSSQTVSVLFKGVKLQGELLMPSDVLGLVLFAHGSGSGRHSPRNQAVAARLRKSQLGTLLFDLLTPEEEQFEAYTRHLRFNISLLAERLVAVTRWVQDRGTLRELPIGYFGSSTGAAAALTAAAQFRDSISAVVSRGGRPDLASAALPNVVAPTLLIVGKDDHPVMPLNEDAYARLSCEKALRVIPGASHLFEEPGKLELVAEMSAEWFASHFHPLTQRATSKV